VLATILELPLEQLPDPSKRAAHNADGLDIVALDETDVEPDATPPDPRVARGAQRYA
jgi:hypothetical protein